MNIRKQARRRSALQRLKDQLKRGFKNVKDVGSLPLTDKDTARIEKEIAKLESVV